MSNNHEHDVFISYSSKDSDIANKICYILEQNNLKCWIAPRNISSGRIYGDEISDAIKSTKIVVLVYSQYSQESKYVDNEIELAFSKDKPIISFNISDLLPKENMEYYLKITQWLLAYPNPEDEFETLVKDTLDLCDIPSSSQVILDLSNYKKGDLSKHKKDYKSLILLCTPFYWVSFIYMGIVSSKNIWILFGLIYLIPTVMCFVFYFQILDYLFIFYPMLMLFLVLFIIFWIITIIHGFLIRNEFLTRRSVLSFMSLDDELFEYLYDEYLPL